LALPKSDPPLGTAGVVRVGAVVPGLPKCPKGPGILKAGVAGVVVVVLGRVGAGNAPKSEGALTGSINTKVSVKSHSGEVMPGAYPSLCFP